MKTYNFHNAFDNGSFRPKQLYIELFKTIPDYFQHYEQDLKIDTTFFKLDKCKELFGQNIETITHEFDHVYSTSKAEEENERWDEESASFKKKQWPDLYVINYDEKWILSIDYNSITCYSKYFDAKSLISKVLEVVPLQPVVPKTASIDLVAFEHNYYTINSKIKRTDVNLDSNYNDDFKDAYKQTIKFLNERESGLVLWYGEKGSGKTSAIRHLLSHTDKKYLLVTNAVAAHMGEPEFISFMMENKDSIFILEDCEQVLMAREENRFGGAIANILNMSDGLMSDIFNIKFICTFNTNIENIDEALLRPGRCFVNYEFKPLNADKSAKLLESLGHSIDIPKAMTLAEIYNYKPEESTSKRVSRKIGF